MDRLPNKAKIVAYTNKTLQTVDAEFLLPINPEQYAQTFKVEYDAKPPSGAQGVESKFKSSAPEELKLDFVLDATDTVYGYAHLGMSVPDQINALKAVAYDLSGPIHQPKYLKVIWTDFTFDCILTELQITYTLFSPEGTPLRAKISCTFLNYIETERRVREEGKSSPDLTHIRTLKAGDTFPLMVHGIYGDPTLYLEVAKANGLNNFRNIPVGTSLFFPPVDKSTA